jgi:hypothetical protein
MPQTVLTDVERRVVGNLSIPRNVADLVHELRQDPYVESLSEADVHDLLTELADQGLVVNLGDGQDSSPGELAAKVDSHKRAVSMPDEKAQNFERRLSQPHRFWRLVGDVWMFTNDGFDKLHEPVGSSARQASLEQVEQMLLKHARNVVDLPFEGSIHDKQGGVLKDTKAHLGRGKVVDGEIVASMLPEEFKFWADQICDAHEEAYGVRPKIPMMGGAGYADATENLIVDAENAKTGYTVTAPWYMALTTVLVTDSDTGSTITEPTGATGYARKSVAAADMNNASAGAATNANAITGAGITGGTNQTCIGFAKCIAATVGVLQKYGTTPSTVIGPQNTPWSFAVGALSTSLD